MTEESSSPTVPLTEKLKGIPGIFGIRLGEEELYANLCQDGDFEIRKYSPFILASISVIGDFEYARQEAFLKLSSYIFGRNKDKKKLHFIVPILYEKVLNGWTTSFILPIKYSLTTVPTPEDKNIHLHKFAERLVATLRYSGANSEAKIEEQTASLLNWINQKKTYSPAGEIQYAQYDGASTIPFLRKHEIHVEVRTNQ